jgi:hypothetical protein
VTAGRAVRALVAAAGLAALVALVGALISSSGSTPGGSGRPGPTVEPPHQARVTAGVRRGINRTLDAFVPAAVRRDDPARAYALTTPSFRGDTTRASWAKGSLPVMPYPAAGRRFHGWKVDFATPDTVGIELELQPSHPAKVGLVAFSVVLHRQRNRWLVDAFAPVATFQPTGSRSNIQAAPDYSPAARGSANGDQRLDVKWILLPVAVIGGPLLALIGFMALGGWRSRRGRSGLEQPLDDYYSSLGRIGGGERGVAAGGPDRRD